MNESEPKKIPEVTPEQFDAFEERMRKRREEELAQEEKGRRRLASDYERRRG